MYRLTRNKKTGHFHLTFHSRNGRVLFQTETFTQKPSAFVNIRSTMKEMDCSWIMLQDDNLLESSKVYVVETNDMYEAVGKPKKFNIKNR